MRRPINKGASIWEISQTQRPLQRNPALSKATANYLATSTKLVQQKAHNLLAIIINKVGNKTYLFPGLKCKPIADVGSIGPL